MQNKGNLEKRRLLKLNFDDELRDLQNGEMRYALNCRVGNSDNDNQGDIENVKGNVLVQFALPSGINKCIGSKEDLIKKRIFYFVYNNLGFHGIYEYSEPFNSVTTILQNTSTDKPLNFDLNYLITGVTIVEDLLYWTDDLNEPMKIDVEKAKSGGYPTPFLVDYIYAIKPPQLCEPKVRFASDKTKNTNFLKQKLFQFKARYVYDNNEKSVPSPISIVALPSSKCNPQTYTDNYIEVIVDTGNEIVKEIEIFAREVSDVTLSQVTDFYTITILNKAELGIPDNQTYAYGFYNDKNYIALDTVRSNQLQDFIPLKAKAQELVDGNRLVYGNIEEGFDPVDVKAKINVEFEDAVTIDTLTIKGRLFIGNPFVDDCSCAYSQPIYVDNNGIEWGGFGYDPGLGNDTVYVPQVGTNYTQSLPLGGFVAYLAGTNYYGVSQQNLPASSYNVFFASGTTAYYAFGQYSSNVTNRDNILNAVRAYCSTGPQVYSTYSITGVTEGNYILRFASHLTTQSDLSDTSLNYQRTSTRTSIVAGKQGHEVAIVFQVVNGKYKVIYDGNDVSSYVVNGVLDLNQLPTNISQYNGNTWILDLTYPNWEFIKPDKSLSAAIEGYVCDKDIVPAPTGTAILDDTRIHLAKVDLISTPGVFGQAIFGVSSPIKFIGNESFVTKNWPNSYTYTDHNGYFFIAVDRQYSDSYFTADIYTGNNLRALKSGDGFYQGNTPKSQFDATQAKSNSYIIQNTSPYTGPTSVQEFARTKAIGYVEDSALPANAVANFNVQVTRGGSGKTDSSGRFEIYVYGNQTDPAIANAQGRNDFIACSFKGDSCFGSVNNKYAPVYFMDLIGSTTQGHNAAVVNPLYYFIPTTNSIAAIVNYKFNPSVSLKRGATYEYGIVYYDHGLRNGTTQTKDYFYNDGTHNYGLKAYIPFYTDTNPATKAIYDSGKPVINWAIAHTPPDWATHYQWVRTKRGSLSNYLQWTLQAVEYVNDLGNPATSFTAATQVKLNLNSIIGATSTAEGYKQRNKNSILSYSFVEGDRIRFIKQKSGAYFPQYYDVEIKGVDSVTNPLVLFVPNNTGSIQLTAGDLIEIYRPQFGNISVEEDIFYEIGECYEIGDAGLPTRYHKGGANPVTTNTFAYHYQDQDTAFNWSFDSVSQDLSGNTVLQGTSAHNYGSGNIGNEIVIENSGNYLPGLSKTAIIVAIPNQFQVVVNIPYDASFAGKSGISYYPATGIFYTGDTYYKLRNIPFSATNNQLTSANLQWWQIEDENFSDFWVSSYPSIGRPNKVDKQFKKIRRPTTIYFSGQFVPETNINDLNNILDVDFETYERTYGSIQRFYNIDRMLDCYQELKVGRIPISQQIWRDAGGSPVAALSNNILNPIQYYSGEYGIGKNPESLSVYGYRRYFLDANRGVFLRLSTDGITPISEHNFKAHNFFTDECKALTALGLPFHVYTVYDQKFTEIVVAFEDVFDDVEQKYEGKTLSFNEDENTWASFYSYKPDFMVTNDTDIITFKNGELWKHNENTVYNNFYGVQYKSIIHFAVNGQPSKEKVFQAISFEDADPWDVIAECPNGMITTLSSSDFELLRNMRYAYFKNDINTPNTWNQTGFNAIIDGQKMQDYVMLVKLISTNKFFQKLYAVNVLWTPVERSNK